jgi:transcriptional regulator of acetoin/glycerol metabolism
VLPEDLPEAVSEASDMTEACRATFQTALGNARRESVMHAWRQARGDYRAAASLLGVHPNSLLRMIRTLGLRDSLKPG